MSSAEQRHDDVVQQVAQQYREEGFTVVVDPSRADLPLNLPFSPDILASRGDQKVVIEVKAAERSSDRERWADLAAAAEQQGWLFRLIVLGRDATPFDFSSTPPERIEAKLARALELSTSDPEAALLLGWAAFEAAARRSLLRAKARSREAAPSALARQLVHNGLLDASDLKPLLEIAARRNAVAHGEFAPGIRVEHIERLARLGRELLKQA